MNDLVGSWQPESFTTLLFPFVKDKNKKIVFNSDGVVFFYSDNKLISEETFKIQFVGIAPNPNHIIFSKKGIYIVSIKENNILSLTKGTGICIDCPRNIFRKQ